MNGTKRSAEAIIAVGCKYFLLKNQIDSYEKLFWMFDCHYFPLKIVIFHKKMILIVPVSFFTILEKNMRNNCLSNCLHMDENFVMKIFVIEKKKKINQTQPR